ncbi:transporter substrate-binding domain-containing protein [Anaerobacillus sp. CMMVII]|uniref:transporter substrate-binding domain-containing protein n=1 Tax=Anaerobacillus sp. CMMVII TaxID=2755588 RepID=UPI0021B74F05|nr:transporter substrate-binding domain-containing protein [Anaerobacillus sp. CMMVII]MCT8138733.1 transporter substrate-binding domain-containing protein [Anaerobacillus sp. CMMVII]
MKILKFALSCVLTVGLLAACGTGDENKEQQGTGGEAPQEKVTLVMGTSADYPPYEFIDTAVSDDIIGFDVDIAMYIAEQLGFELKIQDMDFNGLIPALTNNRVDFVLAGMTPTADRLKNVDFSDIYYVAEQMIVSKADSGLTSLEDLAGKKLGVQLGSIQVELANDIADEVGDVEVLERNKITDLIQELKSNRIHAAIIEDKVAEGHLKANTDLAAFLIEEEGEAGSAIAFPKGSELKDQFNEVLREMIENGEMEKLIIKWFRQE